MRSFCDYFSFFFTRIAIVFCVNTSLLLLDETLLALCTHYYVLFHPQATLGSKKKKSFKSMKLNHRLTSMNQWLNDCCRWWMATSEVTYRHRWQTERRAVELSSESAPLRPISRTPKPWGFDVRPSSDPISTGKPQRWSSSCHQSPINRFLSKPYIYLQVITDFQGFYSLLWNKLNFGN